jgi:hypothetical protein
MRKILSIVLTGMMALTGMISNVSAKTSYAIYFGHDHIFNYNQTYKKIGNTVFRTSNDVITYQYKGKKKKTLNALVNSHVVSDGTTAFYLKRSNRVTNSDDWAFSYNVMKINLKSGKSTKVQEGVTNGVASSLYGYMNGKLLIANEAMNNFAKSYSLINVKKKSKAKTYGRSTLNREDILDQYGNIYIARRNIGSKTILCYKFSGSKGKKLFTVTTKAYGKRAAIAQGKIYYFQQSGSKMLLKRVNLNGHKRKTVKRLKNNFTISYFSDRYVMIKRNGKYVKIKY